MNYQKCQGIGYWRKQLILALSASIDICCCRLPLLPIAAPKCPNTNFLNFPKAEIAVKEEVGGHIASSVWIVSVGADLQFSSGKCVTPTPYFIKLVHVWDACS